MNLIHGLIRIFCEKYHRLQYHPIPLPEQGCAIVASNHISGLDPFLIIAASPRPLRFIIAREEYERFGMKWLFRKGGCIPVDRNARTDGAMREALRALANGEVVALFPHGKIHLDDHPPRKLKAGVARLAERSQCNICPLRITGVKAQGTVVRAVIHRSHAHIDSVTMLTAEQSDDLEMLAKILAGEVISETSESIEIPVSSSS